MAPPVIRHPPSPMLLPVLYSAGNEGRRLPKPLRGRRGASPRCSAIGRRQIDHAPLPELTTCLHSRSPFRSSSSPCSVRHGRRLSSSRSPARFASFPPWIPNPLHPKLIYLPSLLLDPSIASPIDQVAGNRSFSGRQPLKPPELHSAAELPRPVIVFFA